MKCNETVGKWCKNKHGASKIIDTLEMYQLPGDGELRDGLGRCATKLLTPQLAAVEAAEQVQKFRVVGGELTGIGEEGCRREEVSRNRLGETVNGGGGGSTGGIGGGIGRKKK
jgi:hypothetical protein